MFTLSPEFSKQISEFSSIFSKKVFEHAKVLLLGSLLVVGRRTVCSALRAVGLSAEKRFHKYHRVLSRAKWSPYKASNILLKMLVKHFFKEEQRQWSDKAIARTTPILMALFSLITIWADQLNNKGLVHIKPSAWYPKQKPTFSDAIAAVRQQI